MQNLINYANEISVTSDPAKSEKIETVTLNCVYVIFALFLYFKFLIILSLINFYIMIEFIFN